MLTQASLNLITSTRPKVIARNWDRFGGRAHEIVNGLILAERLDVDFFFTWPADPNVPEISEELYFFSTDFIRDHLITDRERGVLSRIEPPAFPEMPYEIARSWVRELSVTQYFVPPRFSEISRFKDDEGRESLVQFSRIARSIISDKMERLRATVSTQVDDAVVIHARYGDLVDGNWKQYVDTSKFISSLSLSESIGQRLKNGEHVLVMSDTPEIVSGLGRIHHQDFSLFSLVPGADRFSRQCAELFALSESKETLAPTGSLFSLFAAHMGGKEIGSLEKIPSNKLLRDLEDSEVLSQHYSHFPRRVRGPLKARDLVHYLNDCAFSSPMQKFVDLSEAACKADDTYVGALCMSAVGNSLVGQSRIARRRVKRAIRKAKLALNIHADPLFVAKATAFAIETLEFAEVVDSNFAMRQVEQRHRELAALLDELNNLNPTQFEKTSVIDGATAILREVARFQSNALSVDSQSQAFKSLLFESSSDDKKDFISNLILGLSQTLNIHQTTSKIH